MDGDDYLELYRHNLAHRELARGPRGWLDAWFRRRLDLKARAAGQADRHGLVLGRVLALTGLAARSSLTVVEIGAGDGLALSHRRTGLACIAIDNGSAFAEIFARRGIPFHVRDVTREALPLADGSADLVMMNHVIEHLDDPAFALGECRRVLRGDGVLYLRTPDIARVGFAFYDDPTHVTPYTPAGLEATLRRFGFAPMFLQHSDSRRTNLDLLTDGRWRRWLLGPRFGGGEIEASFRPASA
jgi:SAM-dependent methyltransferase